MSMSNKLFRTTEVKNLLESYKGKSLEEIPEEHRELVEQVRSLGYDGSRAKKIKTVDIAKNTYDTLAPKCNEAVDVIEGLIQEKNDPSKNIE